MKNIFVLCLAVLMSAGYAEAKKQLPTETAKHVFWMPCRQLELTDFEGDGSENPERDFIRDSMGVYTQAAYWLFRAMDVPIKAKDGMGRKVYVAAAFDKQMSYTLKDADTTGLMLQWLLFDTYEVAARYLRAKIDKYMETAADVGDYEIMQQLNAFRDQMMELNEKLYNMIIVTVVVQKKEDGYEQMRALVDKMLEDQKAYASTPEDCMRFASDKPLDKKYVEYKEFPFRVVNR